MTGVEGSIEVKL